jgi:alkanesulfonate monooxygenase SsuD/methylene tetrahydromethanopterin reductase-like flavin-dependent oxidoreductase (luciferase family)
MTAGPEIAVTGWRVDTDQSAGALCRQAESAEALGFHSYWLPENHFGGQRSQPSPLTLLAVAAARTSTIRLGTTSYLLPIRHPLQAAEEVAVVDQLSAGRLILGLGRGIQTAVFRAFGVPEREKRARFQHNLEIMASAWRGEPILGGESGEADQQVILAPLPAQRPHPPLWVAAFGKLALQQAGAMGLPYLASPIETLGALEANYRTHAEAVRLAGQPGVATVPVMRTVYISNNATAVRAVRDELQKHGAGRLRDSAARVEDWAIIGDRSFVRDKVAEYVDRLHITHLIGGGRLPRLSEAEQLRSHEQFAAIAS